MTEHHMQRVNRSRYQAKVRADNRRWFVRRAVARVWQGQLAAGRGESDTLRALTKRTNHPTCPPASRATAGRRPVALWSPAVRKPWNTPINMTGSLDATQPRRWRKRPGGVGCCGGVRNSKGTHSSSRRKRRRRSRSTYCPGWHACGARLARSAGPQRGRWWWPCSSQKNQDVTMNEPSSS